MTPKISAPATATAPASRSGTSNEPVAPYSAPTTIGLRAEPMFEKKFWVPPSDATISAADLRLG